MYTNEMQPAKNEIFQVSEVSLSYRSKIKPKDRAKIMTSMDAVKILRQVWDDETLDLHETMILILLNRANHVLGYYTLSKGGISGTVADPKMIFSAALTAGASSIILCHNHPSGNLKPSQSDIDLTRKVRDAGKLLEIQLIDHIILTRDHHYSFQDERIL